MSSGSCYIHNDNSNKIAICKEGTKIKIFLIDETIKK